MTPEQQAGAHDANFVEFFRAAAAVLPTGSHGTYGRIPVVATGLPVAFFNGAWLLDPPSQTDLDAALGHLRDAGVPFIVHVRSDLPDTRALLEPYGLRADGRLPCFALTHRSIPDGPDELEMRRVGSAEWDDFLATTAAGFGMPREMAEALYAPAMLELPGVRAYLGYANGAPVATAISVLTGTTLGIYNIGTIPAARGHGYGTAATWHLMRDTEPGWEVAVLQASDMGRPIYERMGFRLVREFVEYVAQPA